jgi:hypothetical protein
LAGAFNADKPGQSDHFGAAGRRPTQFRRIFFGLAGWIDIDSAPMRSSVTRMSVQFLLLSAELAELTATD